jgi:hypothetical protein
MAQSASEFPDYSVSVLVGAALQFSLETARETVERDPIRPVLYARNVSQARVGQRLHLRG